MGNKILERTRLNKDVCCIKLQAPNISKKALPGQFIILRVDQKGERIPPVMLSSVCHQSV